MPLTPEQVQELKAQLSQQLQHLPEEQRQVAQEQIDNMSPEALESMLKQQQKPSKDVFRSIMDGEISARIIDENKDAIAVLDIKPISKGHIIIIPRKPIKNPKDLPPLALKLAKKLSKKIASKLKASSCEIQTEFKFNEIIINIIPIYDKQLNLNSPRYEAKEQELLEIQNKLKTIKKPPVIKIRKPRQEKIIKLPRRIP